MIEICIDTDDGTMRSIRTSYFKIAYRKEKNKKLFLDTNNSFDGFKIIKNKFGCWAADPFLLNYKDKTFLFAEIFNVFLGKGHIEVCCLDDKKVKWKKCKVDECHLSFPNVYLRKTDELFMIPETNEKNFISIYTCDDFPAKWTIRQTLVNNIRAVDSILFSYDGKEYVISYSLSSKNKLKELCFFECIKDEYVLIKKVVDENKNLRPAGKIFLDEDRIILPTQNSDTEYGHGIIFNELDIKSFALRPIKTIYGEDVFLKNKRFSGIHTYNFCNTFEVVDLKYKTFSFLRLIGMPFRKIFKTRKKI